MNERAGIPRERVPPRFVLRVYLYGVLMIALAAGAAFLVGRYSLRPALDGPARPSSTWIAWRMCELADRPEELSAQLTDIKKRVGIDFSVYDVNGQLLASNSVPPEPAVTGEDLVRLRRERNVFGRGSGQVMERISTGHTPRYALLRYRSPEWPMTLLLKQFAVALVVLAAVSVPLARSVTAPLAGLSTLVRRFGTGDLTARVRSRRSDEIGALARAFDDMADRIAALRRSEKELLANISHELRTPLARIRLALELVMDGDRDKASSYLTDIGEDLAELERLLDDVMSAARLDLARDNGGDALPPLHFENISGRTLVEAAVARFSVRYPERTLETDMANEMPTLDADPVVRRVFDNLLDNARKFSEGTVQLTAHKAADGAHLVVAVKDCGIGISEQDQLRIFEPFFRSDRSRTRATGGVGLGLAVVRRIVEAHHGTIEVDSELGAGTRFVVTLPLAHPGNTSPSLSS